MKTHYNISLPLDGEGRLPICGLGWGKLTRDRDEVTCKLCRRTRWFQYTEDKPREGRMIIIEERGSIVLFRPKDDETREWLEDHTAGMWFGGALAVEPRYAEGLAQGLRDEGFPVLTEADIYEAKLCGSWTPEGT